MSKLDNTVRLAVTAGLCALIALPHAATAQGKGHGKAAKHEEREAKAGKRDRDDHDEKNRLVRSDAGTVVQPFVVTQKVKRVPPGLAKKRVTTPQAVLVTRDVLLSNGYQVVQVVPSGSSQV